MRETSLFKDKMSNTSANCVRVLSLFVFMLNQVECNTFVNELLLSEHHHVHCSHEHPKEDQVVRGVHIEPAHLVKRRSIDQPLRISIFYDHSVYRLEPEKFDMINNTILPEAVKFWEQALKVRKTGGPIKLNRKCPTRQVFIRGGRSHCIDSCNAETMCGEVRVPEYHLNPCYVCNSTGHNCRALPIKIEDDLEVTTEINGDNSTDPTVPVEEIEATGVEDTDFVLYVSAVETERCRRGLTVAYASHCQQESALDRPVAGHANFCPGELSTNYRDLPSVLSTVKHEMLHALGFSVSLFGFYRDDNGEPLTERRPDTGDPPLDEELQIHKWSSRVVKNITRRNWMIRGGYMSRTFHMIVTPRVVKEVREHFNCSDLEGAELEDQGGDGTALTHWEKRVFENEAMTGTHTQNSVFSRITFALMEDTGWYRAEYSHASPLHWGRGLGCRFAMASCKQWLNTQRRKNPAPFCERVKGDPLRTECSPKRTAVVLCNLVRHENILPRAYQHFDLLPNVPAGEEAHYGGSVSLADYCPYLQEFTWRHKSVLIRGSRCSYEENTPKTDVNFALENYGPHSKCFDHSDRVWEQKSCRQIREWQHWGSGCYKYKCQSGRLHIVVGNYSYTCYHAGQVLQVRIMQRGWLHRGGVVCPPCKDLCAEEFQSRGEYCKGGEEAPPPNLYPNDLLVCKSPALLPAAILLLSAILCIHISDILVI
ncbi:PREDICTED: leishmanolysin-like peptidase isoform X2 [Papilio polytes]|uniref:leishmanolysin-like peptidase isoform X2 n=1 Tax=Papilio polytes TaxID=76194 RepID=UPI0006766289|nr:PREDICTED: leishmanolysin-like peptidase isoform X2 [Papilio polytes]